MATHSKACFPQASLACLTHKGCHYQAVACLLLSVPSQECFLQVKECLPLCLDKLECHHIFLLKVACCLLDSIQDIPMPSLTSHPLTKLDLLKLNQTQA